jgi:hypothetical protein
MKFFFHVKIVATILTFALTDDDEVNVPAPSVLSFGGSGKSIIVISKKKEMKQENEICFSRKNSRNNTHFR